MRTLVQQGAIPAGRATATWDGTNSRGERVVAGVYFVRFTSAGQRASGKVVRID